jgi:hypothetical protein
VSSGGGKACGEAGQNQTRSIVFVLTIRPDATLAEMVTKLLLELIDAKFMDASISSLAAQLITSSVAAKPQRGETEYRPALFCRLWPN